MYISMCTHHNGPVAKKIVDMTYAVYDEQRKKLERLFVSMRSRRLRRDCNTWTRSMRVVVHLLMPTDIHRIQHWYLRVPCECNIRRARASTNNQLTHIHNNTPEHSAVLQQEYAARSMHQSVAGFEQNQAASVAHAAPIYYLAKY